jgi:hypothetical protein
VEEVNKLRQALRFTMRIFVVAVLLLFTTLLCAQSSPATPPQKLRSAVASHPEWPRAKPADVDTMGDIVRAFYSAISAPAGGKLENTSRDKERASVSKGVPSDPPSIS